MSEPFDADAFLASLTHRPGVYRMHAEDDSILYVGKARDLKRRVASYFGSKAHHPKTQALMSHTQRVEVTVTASEQEALLLEHNLIKQHRPRFNVVLRDDKSYPYIRLTTQQEYPRFEFHRGSRRAPGQYFGPFPSAGAVRQVLAQLQKLFRVRQCKDSFFANRSRPCLQYQIARCTAPCVGLIDADDYRRDARNAGLFLQGRNDQVLADLVTRMESAASQLAYETAATLRDQIASIRDIQATQTVSGAGKLNVDVIGLASEPGLYCVSLIMIRNGRVLGSRNFFPRSAGAPRRARLFRLYRATLFCAAAACRNIDHRDTRRPGIAGTGPQHTGAAKGCNPPTRAWRSPPLAGNGCHECQPGTGYAQSGQRRLASPG